MKKTITVFLIFMSSILLVHSQDYNKWSIEAEAGLSKLHGYTYVVPYNAELSTRYMLNNKFGFKLQGGYTDIKEYDFYNVGFHTVVNLGRVLNFETFTKHYTILAGVGATYTNSSSPILQDKLSMGHLSVFVDNLIKLTDKASLKIGMDFIGDINNRHFDANSRPSTFSRLQNYNIGFVFNLGKQKEHADWYIEQPKIEKIYLKPITIDKTVTNNIKNITDCNCNTYEYVFFKNNSYNVDKDALNSIIKIANILDENIEKSVRLTGFASLPASDDYNFKLSYKRCEAVQAKLISLGISKDRIIINTIGETDTDDSKNIDLARRVLLEIK